MDTLKEQVQTDGEIIEFSVDLPDKNEFVACDQCSHTDHTGKQIGTRSYMFFWFMDGILPYCKHHGERNEEKLVAAGGYLIFDNRESLIENRLKGD